MKLYRSLEHIKAVQFTGDPIPDVTCSGSPEEVQRNGCDSSRKHLPHVHTQAVGGMTVLAPGDWVYPVQGGPFAVAKDAKFRAHWEVPTEVETAPSAAAAGFNVTKGIDANGGPTAPIAPKKAEPSSVFTTAVKTAGPTN